MVNDNLLDFTFEPTEPGQPAKVTWRPEIASYRIEAKVDTVAADGRLETWIRDLGQGRLQVTGKIPAGRKPILRIHETSDAASFARTLFIEALARAGVRVDASPLADHPVGQLPTPARNATAVGNALRGVPESAYRDLPIVAKLVSPPFSENVRLILKVSHNLHASTLPLLVAARHGRRTLADGLRLQHDFLAKTGLDVDAISFAGGAGGARADHVTPRVTVELLRAMAKRPDHDVYRRALPVLGVDGTLAKAAGVDSPARGQVFAKTGTLTWDNVMNGRSLLTSKALAGYMTTSKGRPLAFALFVNGVHLRGDLNAGHINRDLGKLCEIVFEER